LRKHWLNAVEAALCGHPLEKGTSNSGAHRGAPLHYFRKGGTITPPFSKGRLGGIFLRMNSKGISVLFLVIAMLLMVTIGYVFSYLIPTKQKSVRFPIYSTQAFYIAQSGVEFAIRYAQDQGWRGATDNSIFDLNRLNGISRTLGNGTFTLSYNNTLGDILTSTGQITGSTENRVVRVSSFSPFLRLIFDPASPAPCRTPPAPPATPPALARRAQFYIKNVRGTNVTLNGFSASWAGGSGRLQRIYMDQGAGWVQKYDGNYATGTPPPIVNFNMGGNSQTIASNQVIPILVFWNFNLSGDTNIIITFYTAAGDGYTFNLDSAGNGLPTC